MALKMPVEKGTDYKSAPASSNIRASWYS